MYPDAIENDEHRIKRKRLKSKITSKSFLSLNIKIEVKGLKKLQSMLDQKKGIVLITGHFGSWEILGQWVARNAPLFVGVAQKQKNKGAHNFFINQRNNISPILWEHFGIILFHLILIFSSISSKV